MHLTALEDISVALEVGITGKQRERLKNEMNKLNYNIFSATNLVKTIKKKESNFATFIQDKNGLYCTNIQQVITKRVQRLFDNEMLKYSNDQICIVLSGDKGGDQLANTSKFGFFISTNVAPNSYRNFSFLSCWKGDDGRNNQEIWLKNILQQINSINIVKLINGTVFKIEWMFCADLKFLKDTLGHEGCASLHPCSICRVSKN